MQPISGRFHLSEVELDAELDMVDSFDEVFVESCWPSLIMPHVEFD